MQIGVAESTCRGQTISDNRELHCLMQRYITRQGSIWLHLHSFPRFRPVSSGFVTGGCETMVSSCSSPMVFCMQVRLSFVEMVVRRDLAIWMSSFRFLFRFLSHRSFSYGIKSRAPLLRAHLFFLQDLPFFLQITLFQNFFKTIRL